MVRIKGVRAAVPIALFAALALSSGQAAGQDRDPAAAQALFDSARELIRQGKFAEACPKLQESNRLDPALGTQFHLADCYEQSGRVASAWAAFLEVASVAHATNQAEREKVARARADKLQARLPRLVVNVPEASKTPGLEIRRNGMLVGSAQWGTPVAVDPGEVELTASAPGKQTLRQTLRLEEGKTASYSLPALAQGENAAATPVAAPAAEQPAPEPTPAAPPPAPRNSDTANGGRKNVGWVLALGGAGVVGLGISTTFAILAKGKDGDSKAFCDTGNTNSCRLEGVNLRNDAIEKGNVATIAAVAGGLALAGAGVIWLVSGSSEEKPAESRRALRASADVGSGHGAFYLQGSF
jgi:hypothetical protein